MSETPEELVFDTGPLSHFAQQGWLGILRVVTGDRTAVVPETVVDELRSGLLGRPHLQLVLDAHWIEHRTMASADEIREFSRIAAQLVAKGRNLGETGVLAYAKTHGATAIIDDGPARRVAQINKVKYRGTLGLLCDAIRESLLSIDLASAVADHLLESEYRLPFKRGEFKKWVHDQGLLPPTA